MTPLKLKALIYHRKKEKHVAEVALFHLKRILSYEKEKVKHLSRKIRTCLAGLLEK